MGQITLVTDVMPNLLPMEGRSSGMHVSTIIKDLCIRLGHFKDDGSDLDSSYLQLGKAFEYALILMLEEDNPGKYVQPGEQEKDGIYGTPDILDVEEWVIDEVKVAWMSSRHEPDSDKFWRYWTQIKAYCYMVGTTVGRLRICHVVGDWKGSGAKYREWRHEFSEQELMENWIMLRSHGEVMKREMRSSNEDREEEEE